MALGLIEVFGFTTSIVVADAVAKAADVTIVALDKNKPANGDAAEVPLLMTIKFEGTWRRWRPACRRASRWRRAGGCW